MLLAYGLVSRLVTIILVVWLAIGVLSASQRHYFKSTPTTCAHAGTIAETILAGPLNYAGVNPKVNDCKVPTK